MATITNLNTGIEIDFGGAVTYIKHSNVKLLKRGNNINIYDDSDDDGGQKGQVYLTIKHSEVTSPVTSDINELFDTVKGYADSGTDSNTSATIEHFSYNASTDTLEADKSIKTDDSYIIGDKIRLRPSDASNEIPVVEFFNDETNDWETGTIEVGSGSIKVGGTVLSQHGDTMSITDAEGNKKVIPTLKVDNNLIGDSVTVDVGDIAQFNVDVQPVDTFEYVGNELVFYGLGLADSIVSVLKGLSGNTAPTTSIQVILYRGWHSESAILSDPHNTALNKIAQKGIPSSKFGSSAPFDVNLSEAVQFYLNGPYTALMRTTHKDSSNFSLMGNNALTNPLTGGTQFVPKISVDRTVQKNIHLFTERDASHLDADVFAIEGLAQNTDLRYNSLQDAIDACPDKGTVQVVGSFDSIVLPSNKSINIKGVGGASIGSSSYSISNAHCIYQSDSTSTQEYGIYNLDIKNSGGYGVYVKGASKVTIEDCKLFNNGWNGTELNTILDSATSGLLGYDSTNTELQSFYGGSSASNGGAMRLEQVTQVRVIGNEATKNLRGIRLQDCGVNGGGFVTRNVSTQNIESGIYLAAGSTYYGCQNIVVTINSSSYNANNGLLCIGGLNNKFSQNEVNGNWNAGACFWGSANSTLRDCGLYDNNRSQYNGIGNTGDAKASIQINEAYNLLGTNISLNADARFITEVLDTQVHYTGLGSNTERVGLLITEGVGNLVDNDKNIIKVDDVGFIGQDYAIDLSEVDTTNLRVSLGDNSFQSIGEKAIREPLEGYYYELPFSNHSMKLNNVDLSVTNTGNIVVKEGVSGATVNPYSVNELQALAHGSEIKVILKGSKKIQFVVPVSGCSVDGFMVNSVLSLALVQLNDLFTNTTGFASGGNPVTNFVLAGNNLTLTLQDGTSYTVDVTTLGVDENKFVSSGALNGSNLELTMNDASVITIDASNMINASSLPAISNDWFIAYGSNAGDEIEAASIVATYENKQPFYNGDFLGKGEEYVWTHDNNGTYILGVYSGAEETSDELEITYNAKWAQNFKLSRPLGVVRETSVGVDVASRYASGYTITNNTVFALRYGNDNHLYLLDVSDGEVIIGKSNVALVGDTVTISMGGENQPNAKFPVMVKRATQWTIAHDFDNSENGEWNDGVETDTIIKSNMTLNTGEKMLLNFNYFGRAESIGLGYTGASSGVSNAFTNIEYRLIYNASELLFAADTMTATGGEWTWNQNADHYHDPNSDGSSVGYWQGSGVNLGLVSFVYNTDNTVQLYHEGNGEVIADLSTTKDGSPINIYIGFNEAHPVQRIPDISRQDLTASSQPITNFAPDISNQSFDVTEGEPFNVQISLDTGSDIVNIYGEEDAPSWAVLNQSTGVFVGTAPTWTDSASDANIINCKAANALGGVTSFTITLNVVEQTYTNTKSLKFEDGVSSYLGGNASLVTSMERASNGSGSSDAWSFSLWFKGSIANSGQTVFYFGNNDVVNNGHIELRQTNHNGLKRLRLRYGSNGNHIQITTPSGSITPSVWQHVLVTYDGGTTGASSGSVVDYYSRFKIYIDGVLQSTSNTHSNYGYSGSVVGQNFRIGRFASGTYPKDMIFNQLAIWGSDQSANISDIYNSGETRDLSALTDAPEHYYEIETSVSTIQDLIGTAHLVGYNFTSSDLVTDAP